MDKTKMSDNNKFKTYKNFLIGGSSGMVATACVNST
jgi:hypothetical protein